MTVTDDLATPGALNRLHNSGPIPHEVFRTPVIGAVMPIYLAQTIIAWDGWQDRPLYRKGHLLPALLPPAFAHEAARRVLVRLGETEVKRGVPRSHERATQAACALLAEVSRMLRARGDLKEWVGIATWETFSDPKVMAFARRDKDTPPDDLEVARTIVAYSVFAPPLLLWTRSPSLHYWRKNGRITLRRFDQAGTRRPRDVR